MQTLEYTKDDLEKAKKEYKTEKEFPGKRSDDLLPVAVSVQEIDHNAIEVTIAGASLVISVKQARDLALVLRQTANRVERNTLSGTGKLRHQR